MGALDALSLANIGIFVAVLLLVEAVVTIVIDLRPGSAQRSINRRLKLLSSGLDGQTVLARLRRRGSGEASPLVRVESLLQRAGLDLSLTRLAVILAGGGLGLAALGIAVSHLPPERAVLMAAAAVLLLPPPLLAFLVRRRLKKFAEQLPDAIDVIVRSLRAGHPVSTAIGMVCREMPDPVGSEFGIAFDEMTYGLDLREALDNLATRIAIEELRFMVVAVRIQYATGGNLAEVLAGLSKVIRDHEAGLPLPNVVDPARGY
ncbi:MAG: type II secretion system F family protein [Rhodospirillales bacterium]|nr:type II secretion system F family protein [Rhodospirillales bacterium]